MHSVFSDIYGRRPYEIAFYLCTIAIYLIVLWLADREQRR
jgi:hypothetical protein